MIENDYVPSYLADVFEKPDGWIETPEADPDADAKLVSQSVYAVADCEMVCVPSCVPGYRMLTKTNISASPRTARR